MLLRFVIDFVSNIHVEINHLYVKDY